MYAHLNVWRLNDAGAAWKDDAAKAIAGRLAEQPGFRAYTVVRTGEWELTVLTVFDTRDALDRAVEALALLVRDRIAPLVEPLPERREGPVVMHAVSGVMSR